MIRSALLLALSAAVPLSHAAPDLTTVSERSGFQNTGRYDEVIKLCAAFQQAYPKQVKCIDFGTTPEGRPMKALIVTRTGAMTPQAAQQRGLPVVLIQGGIHAGEIDGKDAGFLALREMLENRAAAGRARQAGAAVRPGVQRRRPRALHAEQPPEPARPGRNGLAHHGAELQPQPRLRQGRRARDAGHAGAGERVGSAGLRRPARHRRRQVRARRLDPGRAGVFGRRAVPQGRPGAARQRHRRHHRAGLACRSRTTCRSPRTTTRHSGFVDGVSDPRFSTGYFQLRNRMAMLVETHSWKDYPTRVRITHNAIVSVLAQVAKHGAEWQQAAADGRRARAEDRRQRRCR